MGHCCDKQHSDNIYTSCPTSLPLPGKMSLFDCIQNPSRRCWIYLWISLWIYFPDNLPLESSQAHHSRHIEGKEEAQTLSAATKTANGNGSQERPSASPIPKTQIPHPGEVQTDRWTPSSRGTLEFKMQQETSLKDRSRWLCCLDLQAEINDICCLLTTSIFILGFFPCRN